MKTLKEVSQSEVLSHWEKVEASDGGFQEGRRSNITAPLVDIQDLKWYEARIEANDIENIYIISSIDWIDDGFCTTDLKLVTATANYKSRVARGLKVPRINRAKQMFLDNMASLDTKFLLVADNTLGPYTIIEGNKRSVALMTLDRIVGIQVYLGVSSAIKGWIWSQGSYTS